MTLAPLANFFRQAARYPLPILLSYHGIGGWLITLNRFFFRKIIVLGSVPENVITTHSLVVVANHSNHMFDPIALGIPIFPRPMQFMAKAPLFDIPVFGAWLRAMGVLPVARSQDGATNSNKGMMDEAARSLAKGACVGIFVEGGCRPAPWIRPLKPGAVRLGHQASLISGQPSLILPMVFFFEDRENFHGRAWLNILEPIVVDASKSVALEVHLNNLAARMQAGLTVLHEQFLKPLQTQWDRQVGELSPEFSDWLRWHALFPDKIRELRALLISGRHVGPLDVFWYSANLIQKIINWAWMAPAKKAADWLSVDETEIGTHLLITTTFLGTIYYIFAGVILQKGFGLPWWLAFLFGSGLYWLARWGSASYIKVRAVNGWNSSGLSLTEYCRQFVASLETRPRRFSYPYE